MRALIRKQEPGKIEPILRKVLAEAENEHRETEEVFELMGWAAMPQELKMEIKDDIQAFREELIGNYSTCDPYVYRRRQRIDYWVRAYSEGLCALKTAVNALRVKPL